MQLGRVKRSEMIGNGQWDNDITNLHVGTEYDRDMNLSNESYVIIISTTGFSEFYYRDADSWLKISACGKTFRATAEQVLNHVLPALAGVKSNVTIKVEHFEDPGARVLKGPSGEIAI